MPRIAAVVAHYDPDNILDATFHAILENLESFCDRIILVTTASLAPESLPTSPKIKTICRPNIGYDFYSYRVGIVNLLAEGGCDRMLLLNSSYLITDSAVYGKTIEAMVQQLDHADVIGITESRQWQWHIQSYLVAMTEVTVRSTWFQSWLETISPCNTKFETILSGELGLSAAIMANGAKVATLFRPSSFENCKAMILWARKSLTWKTLPNIVRPSFWFALDQFNPTHFQAHALARQKGLVKTELVRNNPHQLNLNWLPKLCQASDWDAINQFVNRSKAYYESKPGSMTALATAPSALPSQRIIHSGSLGRPGVRIAVIAHIFYPELAHEIYGLINNIVEPFDLIVTTPHEAAVPELIDFFSPLASSVTVALSENRGRDVGPFLAVHRSGMLERYDAVLKLHSKKSTYSESGQYWQQSLFRHLCGDSQTVNRIVALLRAGKAGMVGPHEYYLTHPHYWGANLAAVHTLMQSLSPKPLSEADVPLGFFAGTMFWFNPKAISMLHHVPESLLVFEPENGKQDGTLAHAIERLFGILPRLSGYSVSSLRFGGQDMDETTAYEHTVPVLKKPPPLMQ